ncbi:MAG: transglutaminase family protein, partial [Methanobacterium sp.]|nr:transglutaminase family protein [Methanobacterium sp.]
SSGTANCCDTTNLLVALTRAAGIPARYEHGECTFSDGVFGHVWAQVYVNGNWYRADAISDRNSFGVINNWDTSNWTLIGIYAELPF